MVAGCVLAPPAGADGAEAGAACGRWSAATVASGFLPLENLAFDGRGGVLLSEYSVTGSGGSIRSLMADGTRGTVVGDADGPGAIVVDGATVYFNSGNTMGSGLLSDGGQVRALNRETGEMRSVATGLSFPNGLAVLPDGSVVTSSDLGRTTGLTRTVPGGAPGPYATGIDSSNGLAYSPARRKLYVATTFVPVTTIVAVDIDHPEAQPQRIELPGLGFLNAADDLAVGPDQALYVALNGAGRIVRIDPDTADLCTIAENLPLISSVRFGAGPGWDPRSLYATSFLGTVTRIRE